jgi:nicotinamide-nucleotide amidase
MNQQIDDDAGLEDGSAPRVRLERTGPATAEIISVGRELLNGRVADTNAGTLARLLTRRGATVKRATIVGHEEDAVASAIRETLSRNRHLVVISGGLGPAAEDRTIHALSVALRLPLEVNRHARSMVEEAYQRLRKKRVLHKGGLTASREKMCTIPVGATPVENGVGIAPGVICRLAGGTTVFCLPGLPGEAEAVFETAAPDLKLTSWGKHVAVREIEAPTADESSLTPMLDQLSEEFPGVAVHSRPGNPAIPGQKVMISLEAGGSTAQEANTTVDGVVRRLLALAAGSP